MTHRALNLLLICLSISLSFSLRPQPSSNNYRLIPISKDSFGNHYIEMNWSPNHLTSPDPDQQSEQLLETSVKMVMSLYSNETFVAKCPGFHAYPVGRVNSIQSGEHRPVQYLYQGMDIEGQPIRLDIQTPGFFAANSPALLATKCSQGFTNDAHGYIGLGSDANFLTQTIGNFSIFLSKNKDKRNSTMYIGQHSALSGLHGKKGFSSTIQVGQNWEMTMSDIRVDILSTKYSGKLNLTKKYNVVFDLNTPYIGVPLHLYKFITKILEGFNVFCNETNGTTNCVFKSDVDITTLPSFRLMMDSNTTGTNFIPLPPTLYFADDNMTLLIKSVSDDSFGSLKVHTAHKESVILGAPFLQFYYVHFQQGENGSPSQVIMQYAHHGGTDRSQILLIVLIILVSYICILVLAFVLYLLKFKQDDPIENRANEEEVEVKVSTPLLGKSEEMTEKNAKGSFIDGRKTAAVSMAE